MTKLKCKYKTGYPFDELGRINFVKNIALSHKWKLIEYQDNIGMLYFHKTIDDFACRINVYVTKMSVTTYINHPKKGKGQLYRKNITPDELSCIFKNPRFHTNKGYYTK